MTAARSPLPVVSTSSSFVILLLLLQHLDLGQGQDQGFLYVPRGKTEDEGQVLRETSHEKLPVGEYEIVAMFDKPDHPYAFLQQKEQETRTEASPYSLATYAGLTQSPYSLQGSDISPYSLVQKQQQENNGDIPYSIKPLQQQSDISPFSLLQGKRYNEEESLRPPSPPSPYAEQVRDKRYDFLSLPAREQPQPQQQQQQPPSSFLSSSSLRELEPPTAEFSPPAAAPVTTTPSQQQPTFVNFPSRTEGREEGEENPEKRGHLGREVRANVIVPYDVVPRTSMAAGEEMSRYIQMRREQQQQQQQEQQEEQRQQQPYYTSSDDDPSSYDPSSSGGSRPAKFAKDEDYSYRRRFPPHLHRSPSYDPRRGGSGGGGRQEEQDQVAPPRISEGEEDHWAEHDGGSTRQKQPPPANEANDFSRAKDDSSLFVTPLPPTTTKKAKRKVTKENEEDSENELKKLHEIATGGGATRTKAAGSAGPTSAPSPPFVCPRDGHFGDKNDCAKFYRCAHGTALVEYCPGGLFWNSVNDQCDWPETVDCSYNSVSLESYRAKRPTTIYLTFDDGPNEGTEAILKALRKHGVKATFFINSQHIMEQKNPNDLARNVNNLITMIKDGHVLADHSFDHMYHNSKNSPKNAYTDVEEDIKYFGVMNTYPVLDILWKAGMKEYIGPVNHTMSYFVRMPYTNAWRAGSDHRDCYACTIPASSGQKGIEISNLLHAEGRQIIGWDQEWEIEWSRNRFKYGGKEMFFRMARDERNQAKGKMVILSHDIAYREHEVRDEQKELEEYIELAQKAGYKFDTIDHYL